jgi:hypothetical protein
MPSYERLLVVAPDGRVLAEVDGTSSHVLLPEDIFRSLSAGTLHATLVHNHPGGVSLSGDDLAQLGKPGVDRVIAVGHDGSVFEASIGMRFNGETFETVYRARLAEVMETVARAARRDNIDPSALAPLVCHLVAEVLDRAEVINYRTTLSLDTRVSLDRYHRIVQSAVGLISSR